MRLADLVDQLDLPETGVAEGAWDAARRRTRRRRAALVGASAAVVLVVVGASALSLRGEKDRPLPAGPDPTPTVTMPTPVTEARGIDHAHTQRLLTPDLWAELDDVPTLDPGATTDLVDDPMVEGVFATVDPEDGSVPIVLGSDGRWRRISEPDLDLVDDGGGYTSPVIAPTAFSPDGSRLALPQPGALVVVDLTDGGQRTYPLPGSFIKVVIWADGSHVLVASETDTTGTLVDLDTGETSPSAFGPSTAFTDDGPLTWGGSEVLDWATRPDVPTPANNGGGLNPYPPLVHDGIAVGDMTVGSRQVGSEDPPLGNGVVAVDTTTGDVLAYLPAGPGPGLVVLLGWQGDLPVVGLFDRTGEHLTMAIVAWDYQATRLEPLARTSGITVAWRGPVG